MEALLLGLIAMMGVVAGTSGILWLLGLAFRPESEPEARPKPKLKKYYKFREPQQGVALQPRLTSMTMDSRSITKARKRSRVKGR